ncbi:hypothetical protein MHBO_002362 [Bonamia ostreae]|uniref:60S ribosomal protein L35 n=1 Tax=Bonamia ostreae TaxID=126728 RepID=A0ABV2AN26_9EUKA
MPKLKLNELREKSKEDLLKLLADLRKESFDAKISSTRSKNKGVSGQKLLRKNIARVLTVYNQNQKAALKEHYKGKRYVPLDLRPKQTRAFRRRLTEEQLKMKTPRQLKREKAFPPRMYALRN